MTKRYCDVCGKEIVNAWRLAGDARDFCHPCMEKQR